jgi:antibiotic biosynthesis monooxygenase (ABM) superfamily enzyme
MKFRLSEEEKRNSWFELKKRGRKRFVWRYGILLWGLWMFLVFSIWTLFRGPRTHALSIAKYISLIILNLIVWSIGGLVFGLFLWSRLQKKYDN